MCHCYGHVLNWGDVRTENPFGVLCTMPCHPGDSARPCTALRSPIFLCALNQVSADTAEAYLLCLSLLRIERLRSRAYQELLPSPMEPGKSPSVGRWDLTKTRPPGDGDGSLSRETVIICRSALCLFPEHRTPAWISCFSLGQEHSILQLSCLLFSQPS